MHHKCSEILWKWRVDHYGYSLGYPRNIIVSRFHKAMTTLFITLHPGIYNTLSSSTTRFFANMSRLGERSVMLDEYFENYTTSWVRSDGPKRAKERRRGSPMWLLQGDWLSHGEGKKRKIFILFGFSEIMKQSNRTIIYTTWTLEYSDTDIPLNRLSKVSLREAGA